MKDTEFNRILLLTARLIQFINLYLRWKLRNKKNPSGILTGIDFGSITHHLCAHIPPRSNPCSLTGVTTAMVYAILSGMVHIKDRLLLNGKNGPCHGGSGFLHLTGPLPRVRR